MRSGDFRHFLQILWHNPKTPYPLDIDQYPSLLHSSHNTCFPIVMCPLHQSYQRHNIVYCKRAVLEFKRPLFYLRDAYMAECQLCRRVFPMAAGKDDQLPYPDAVQKVHGRNIPKVRHGSARPPAARCRVQSGWQIGNHLSS